MHGFLKNDHGFFFLHFILMNDLRFDLNEIFRQAFILNKRLKSAGEPYGFI